MIKAKEHTWVREMQSKSQAELQAYHKQMKAAQETWEGSYPWQWCAFERNFYIDSNGNIH